MIDKYNLFLKKIEDCKQNLADLSSRLNVSELEKSLDEIRQKLASEDAWNDTKLVANLNKEIKQKGGILSQFQDIEQKYKDIADFFKEISVDDEESLDFLEAEYKTFEPLLEKLNITTLFSSPEDNKNCFLEIHPGSGGTEAQDWAEMLMRMYVMWATKNEFKVEIEDSSKGDVAGIKNAILKIEGDYAYGKLKWETGVHRLVRKSPFDSGNRRHTSFASVFVSPEVDDSISIDISPADLLIETYRSGGAGGQHVNKTDSAVRITHLPTKLVAQCQSERSQHQNKAHAMVQLRSKLFQLEIKKKNAIKEQLEATKEDISWGNQIRSYVLDSSRIKDLRTGYEVSDCQSVLDGDINGFLEASLKGIKENS